MVRKGPKKRTTIYIDSDVWKKLQHIALDEGVSASELLEKILREKLMEHTSS
jgi:predicted CopG family antitoxin